MSIGAVIITKNEEDNLERCLRSLSFCDEIVVVDAESNDGTLAIAHRYSQKVHTLPWSGFVKQRQTALGFVESEWILSIDADEEVSPELRAEILATVSLADAKAAYSVPRKTIHFGRWIRHGGWYPNRLVRLFQKGKGEWRGNEVHEYWHTESECGELKADLIHYSFENLSDQVARNNTYSSLGARGLKAKGVSFSFVWLFAKTTSKFLETYVLKRGFLDGYPGLIISVSAAYSVFLKWAKLWELESGEKGAVG